MSDSVGDFSKRAPLIPAQSPRSLWRWAVLVFVLAGALFLFEEPGGPRPLLPQFDPDSISKISLQRAHDSVVLKRAGAPAGQPITAPKEAEKIFAAGSSTGKAVWAGESGGSAAPEAIEALLRELSSATISSRGLSSPASSSSAQSGGVSAWGFDEPTLIITLNSGEVSRKVTVGSYNDYLRLYYVRINDEPQVLLSQARFVELALRPAEDFALKGGEPSERPAALEISAPEVSVSQITAQELE